MVWSPLGCAGAARFCPPPASASGRSGDRSAAQTGGCRWSVGQIGLSKAAAAPRHDASSFRGGSARATSRASFGRQTEAFEVLSLLRRSRSNPFLGGHSDGADRASKKATECQLLFFWASVSTFENRLPSKIPRLLVKISDSVSLAIHYRVFFNTPLVPPRNQKRKRAFGWCWLTCAVSRLAGVGLLLTQLVIFAAALRR